MLPIYESYPKNPSTTVVLNNFYPKGLKEIDIYKYYISVKKQLLEELKNREVMFFINPKINKSIVKRKDPKTGSFFKLTDNNYEKLITGRTVSVHSTMNKSESFGIIDIDFDDFNQAKKATNEIYNFCLDSI